MDKNKEFFLPEDIEIDYQQDLGNPGEFPFTRGIHETMYRGRLWTMRQFAGFGTAKETNRRFRQLLKAGETGLSTAFDTPTLYGYDSDHPLSVGEVGKGGVAIDTLDDMKALFRGIPLDRVSTSMTINGPASILLAMYAGVAKQKRIPLKRLRGTTQNDILKEYIIQKETIVPHEEAMKIFVDTVEFCMHRMPQWNPVSISGYHIREGGATAIQELAFTLADGIAYVEACIARGLDVDEFTPRFSFFFDIHNNFFEEIAKFRAARRMWARIMRERFSAKNERSWKLRTHAQTAGCTLTTQQPQNNIVRVTLQALAAVLGGVQSLHTNSYDEQETLPSEEAVMIALRTQQILAEETGLADTVDPLGGSWYIEHLTNELEEKAWGYIKHIDEMGGMVSAVKQQYPQQEIARSSYKWQKAVEKKEILVVGVNKFLDESEKRSTRQSNKFRWNPKAAQKQVERLQKIRQERSEREVQKALDAIKYAAEAKENVMYPICEAVGFFATEGEIVTALKEVYGEYIES